MVGEIAFRNQYFRQLKGPFGILVAILSGEITQSSSDWSIHWALLFWDN
jgi:hypothetical protein